MDCLTRIIIGVCGGFAIGCALTNFIWYLNSKEKKLE